MASQRTILVVEDNEINRAILCGILSQEYQVLEAENGKVALDILHERGEEVSLILLDIMMPVMNGYTFLSLAKRDEAISAIPVIVTTQSDSEEDEVAALAHGATDFVAKPYRAQVILHRVASIIKLRETAAMINQFKYDRLTGLYSKEYFYQRVRDLLRQNPDRRYTIICSDIENFKLTNDVFGVPAGDQLLRDIAGICREFVGEGGFCGRLSGDQFAALLENPVDCTEEAFARITARVATLANAKSVVLKWGVYYLEDRSVTVEQACDRALLAARSVRGQYGRHFAAYDDALRGELLRQQAITEGMETALAEGQFTLYLQPKYDIRDERLAGAEALVRWVHPEWGFQSPDRFIPLFEKNGFITKMDRYIWDQACAALRSWDDKGYPPIAVSVNVSRADIYQADLPEILVQTVEKYGLSPARLHLEITESAYTEDPRQIIDTAARLRERGFIIEMDDFGSGYSSLNMLNQLPLDILKLDMQFIRSETAKPSHQGILRFIMELARWMDLKVVAEGVETREQVERLREIGCDYVQGFYFARPMPCREFEALLERQEPIDLLEEPRRDTETARAGRIVLVVDEDQGYRREVRDTFESAYQVVEAAGAEEALEQLHAGEGRVAALILSLTLPETGGLPLLEAIQREHAAWSTAVITTAPADERWEERALTLGADDFVAKPHSQTTLWRRALRAMNAAAAREREHSLRQEAYRDYLTGLFNRRGMIAAAQTLRREDRPAAVCLFDLDNLKQINDTCGHMEGDRLITRFGELLRAHTREDDLLVRYGGDEFVVILRHMKGHSALRKGEEICRAFRELYAGEAIQAACTGGVVQWEPELSLEAVIDRADQALYEAKAHNKGGCKVWGE